MFVREVPVGVMMNHLDVLARNDEGVVVVLVVNHNVVILALPGINHLHLHLSILTFADLVSVLRLALLLSQGNLNIALTFDLEELRVIYPMFAM